jgi:hypothetical protein
MSQFFRRAQLQVSRDPDLARKELDGKLVAGARARQY